MDSIDSMDDRELTPSRGWILRLRSGQALPHGKDVQSPRPIRSQEFILSEGVAAVEGHPLSYGCVS